MILVTGGTGFVGSHLLAYLTENETSVRALYRENSDLNLVKKVFGYYTSDFENRFKKIEWIQAELNDIPSLQKAFKGVQYVYHCAAMVSFDPGDYFQMRKVNIEGTVNIVNLSISTKIKKLCFVSSIATLEKPVGKNDITEEDFWQNSTGKSGYAITKHGAESEVWRAGQEGISVVIVNPGVIIGAGFWDSGSGKLFKKIYNGLSYYTDGITGFVGVNDVVKVMITLMNSTVRNENFILVSENESFKDVLSAIADSVNVKRPNKNISKNMIGIAWRLDHLKSLLTGKKPLLTKFSAKAMHNKKFYSSEKVQKTLNFKFEDLEDTVKKTGEFFLNDHR